MDLKNLGKRSWIDNVTKPKGGGKDKVDSGVVTRYGAVPSQNVDELKALVLRDNENLELKDMLAFSLYSNDRIDEAIALFKELLNKRHRVDLQRLYLGNCFYKKKLYHLAVTEWEFIVKMAEADPAVKDKAKIRLDKVRAGVAVDFD